jgi:hypothetical protein
MKQIITILFYFFSLSSLLAQVQFKGRVLDDSNGEPLPLARVFINNSTKGAIADKDGAFSIRLEEGRHEVIVNYLGYATISYTLNTQELRDSYVFRLSPQAIDLNELEVKATRDKEWYINLELFKQNFIGTSNRAKQCKILNEEKLIFEYDPKERVLIARAREPLIISNPALGYKIEYILENFEFHRRSGFVYFEGYPSYQNMEGGNAAKRRWAKAREDVYFGSAMHFVRTLYQGMNLEKEGFNVRKLERITDTLNISRNNGTLSVQANNNTANASSNSIKAPGRTRDVLHTPLLDGSGLVTEIDGEIVIQNPGHLYQIIYTKATEEPKFSGPGRKPGPQTSIITLNGDYLVLDPSGNYFPPMNLFFEGYWAWYKVADLLPLDYTTAN